MQEVATKKENIAAPIIEGPKVLGKINLETIVPVPVKKRFTLLGSFPIEFYDKVLNLAKIVNKNLQVSDAITLSKIAKDKEGNELPNQGSIWFSCDWNTCRTQFQKPLNLMLVEEEHYCKRINKEEMNSMLYGQNFFMCYMFKNNSVKVSPCIKIFTSQKDSKKGISYTRKNDKNQNANLLLHEDINADGTFKANEGEGYLFVSKVAFNEDL